MWTNQQCKGRQKRAQNGLSIVKCKKGKTLTRDSNLPPLIILVLATPAVSGRRIVRAFAIGIPVLTLGHVAFITAAFLLRDQIRNQPEIPTGVGYVLLTLPFVLWILLIHWETIAKLLPLPEDSSPPET